MGPLSSSMSVVRYRDPRTGGSDQETITAPPLSCHQGRTRQTSLDLLPFETRGSGWGRETLYRTGPEV